MAGRCNCIIYAGQDPRSPIACDRPYFVRRCLCSGVTVVKMRLTILAALIIVLTADGASGQMDCPKITNAKLESVIAGNLLIREENVDVLSFHPVCLAYSQERDRYRFVSVVVEYTCTGNARCPSGTAVEQFESQCI